MRIEADGLPRQLGLLAERVTTAEIDDQARATTTDKASAMDALGPILLDDQGMFQLIDLSRLLSDDRRSAVQLVASEGEP